MKYGRTNVDVCKKALSRSENRTNAAIHFYNYKTKRMENVQNVKLAVSTVTDSNANIVFC